jgi:hypothetical protein
MSTEMPQRQLSFRKRGLCIRNSGSKPPGMSHCVHAAGKHVDSESRCACISVVTFDRVYDGRGSGSSYAFVEPTSQQGKCEL